MKKSATCSVFRKKIRQYLQYVTAKKYGGAEGT